ncbi:4-hydroxy-tetrahydrodipicolinate synthase [Vallitalea okinawensis]|uniref:4-hydroxy-tetrahydrodipicolinate synthase n=1 Tax=Vallitalea okinawensis TaxID=2078660 RepID=UPI000CFC4A3B|nr:4-hydroxy-tetrahydrodipicolinate synthase [Vallitalea okinawensis]
MSLFTGSGVAIVTPFTETGVNYEVLEKLIEFHISNHTDCIVICGTTGEASTMTDEEQLECIRFTVEKVNKRVPVIAGTGSNYTEHALHLTRKAEEVGADAALIVTPYYNKTTQKGLYEHYAYIANNVKIPIVLYNVPSRTGIAIEPTTAAQLAEIENIIAVKEASGNISTITEMMALCGDKLDLYSGNDDQVVPLMSIGGKGVISVAANIVPRDLHDLVQKFMDGDLAGSRKMQLDMMPLNKALFSEVNPIPVKEAMNILGMEAGPCRLPLTSMDDSNRDKLMGAMQDYGLKF